MAKVSDWFGEWAMNLVSRSGRNDWPTGESEMGREFWADMQRSLVRVGATFKHADDASSAACDRPGLFPNQFRAVIIEAIQKSQKAPPGTDDGSTGTGTMDEAKQLSRNCIDCGGCGLAIRFIHPCHEEYFKTIGGSILPVGAKITFRCSCDLGKLCANIDKATPKDKGPVPRSILAHPEFLLGEVPWSEMWDNQYRYKPNEWNAVDRRPADAPLWTESPALAREHFRSLAAQMAKGPATATRGHASVADPLTPSQEQFLVFLPAERRSAFALLSPGRQAEILGLFRNQITDREIRRAMAEIPEPTPPPKVEPTRPLLTDEDDTTDYSYEFQ